MLTSAQMVTVNKNDTCAAGVLPTSESNKSKRRRKKKKNRSNSHTSDDPHKSDIWFVSDRTEKQRIKEFWMSLAPDERKALVKLEKELVLKKIKEQQRQACSCSVCGRKRSIIEEELDILYEAYYGELEQLGIGRRSTRKGSDQIIPIEPFAEDSDESIESLPIHIYEFGNSLTVQGEFINLILCRRNFDHCGRFFGK
jgi:hypothetical protein